MGLGVCQGREVAISIHSFLIFLVACMFSTLHLAWTTLLLPLLLLLLLLLPSQDETAYCLVHSICSFSSLSCFVWTNEAQINLLRSEKWENRFCSQFLFFCHVQNKRNCFFHTLQMRKLVHVGTRKKFFTGKGKKKKEIKATGFLKCLKSFLFTKQDWPKYPFHYLMIWATKKRREKNFFFFFFFLNTHALNVLDKQEKCLLRLNHFFFFFFFFLNLFFIYLFIFFFLHVVNNWNKESLFIRFF